MIADRFINTEYDGEVSDREQFLADIANPEYQPSSVNIRDLHVNLYRDTAVINGIYHDTSSVVGATAKFGALALAVGTTVKLARALWIVPVSIATAIAKKSKAKIQWPWFIGFFCLAALANTYLPALHAAYPILNKLGKTGLTVTLFLIGTGLSRETLKRVGVRPLAQGVLLWAIVALGSLGMIRLGWIHL